MLNPLQIGLLSINLFYSSLGFLVYNYEKYMPAFVLRAVKYGAFTYTGHEAVFMKKLDIPKYYYRHFYVFAVGLGIANLTYMILVYFCDFQVNVYYVKFLHAFHGDALPVSVLASMTSLFLLLLQSIKRCYEANYKQVFAKSSKIYPTHYLGGFFFYLVIYVAIIGQAPLFCGDKNRNSIIWTDLRTVIALVPGVPMFFWALREQYLSNLILANLRKDKKSGQVVTEEHKIPRGRLFESISSPHRCCEVILYAALFTIMQTKTFFFISLWVLCNQILTSKIVHHWYTITFTNYPKERYAIFKGFL